MLTALNSLLRTLVSVVMVALLVLGGWIVYQIHLSGNRLHEAETQLAQRESQIEQLNEQLSARQREIAAMAEELKAKGREIQRLLTANRLLTVDRRVARIDVVSQTGSAAAGDLATKFSFVEVGSDDRPLDVPRVFTVRGDLIYLDAWVIKYEDRLVESGDPLHAMSVCLFRRVFGELQQPKDGFVLDPVGATPAGYRTGQKMSDLEREIWSRFWDYANDAALAGRAGVRAAHGEAPSIKLTPGKRYKVLLRASAGLEIVTEDVPSGRSG
jgi:uncharacterized coiled-coil protein SlyX